MTRAVICAALLLLAGAPHLDALVRCCSTIIPLPFNNRPCDVHRLRSWVLTAGPRTRRGRG